jgi:hypothetical protein
VFEYEPASKDDPVDAAPSVPVEATPLEVGDANDTAEQEADRTADRVMRAMGSDPRGRFADAITPQSRIQRSSATVGAAGGVVDADTDSSIRRAQRSGGTALPSSVAEPLAEGFGQSVSQVRVHTGTVARQLNDDIAAEAFTLDNHVFFRDGLPDMSSSDGQHLMAHEVAHVQQQSATARRSPRIQRMPSAATIKERTGKGSKSGKKVFGKTFGATNSYNDVLAAVTAYRSFLESNMLPPNEMLLTQALDAMRGRLKAVVTAAEKYKTKKKTDPAVVTQCDELIAMAPHELRVAGLIGRNHIQNAVQNPSAFSGTSWVRAMPRDPRTYSSPDTVAAQVGRGGQSKSGANKTTHGATSDGKVGFFAADAKQGDGSAYENPQWMFDNYGMKETDLRLANRSIAMSRLDSLLSGGVIAKTKAASRGSEIGTFMEKADGDEAVTVLTNTPAIAKDPELARLLSRVQLIDAIAGQVDRHAKNYFIKTDPLTGKVVSVTGIDLDMAFMPSKQEGSKAEFNVDEGSRMQKTQKDGSRLSFDHFPGFSKFVDAEFAEIILKIDPMDVRAVFSDLIEPWAVDAAIARLMHLKTRLAELKSAGKLLQPDQWKDVLHGIVDEDKSYYARDAKS